MSLTSFMMRRGFGKSDKKRDAGLTTPADVKRFDDIAYGHNRFQVLDVYRPANVEGILPVIVSVHGGGWMYGSKEVYQFYCMSLAQRGFAVVNFTYRLAPEYKFPAGIEDTNMVFAWMKENAQMYGFDMNNLFAVGDSAGGHMLTVYASMLTNPEYEAQFDFPLTQGIKLNAVGLNCGKYDMREMLDRNSETAKSQMRLMKEVLPKKGTDSEIRWVTPIDKVTSKFPPAFVMTATEDFLKEQAPLMVAQLEEQGVEYKYKIYGTPEKPLYHVFHCDMRLEEAKQCNDDECEFFKAHMV